MAIMIICQLWKNSTGFQSNICQPRSEILTSAFGGKSGLAKQTPVKILLRGQCGKKLLREVFSE